jgi:hypothetical protein
MTILRRLVILIGVIWITGVCLFPPYSIKYIKYSMSHSKISEYAQPIGHYWIGDPPKAKSTEWETSSPFLDMTQLTTHIVAALTATVILFLFLRGRGGPGEFDDA